MELRKDPLITIITVCYNSDKTIIRTISSVLKQTYQNWEYILVDGKSQDRTVELINEVSKNDNRILYISEKDDGLYHAMNKGINMSKGDIIGIINSDDWYETNALDIVASMFKNHGSGVYHGYERKIVDGQPISIEFAYATNLEAKMIQHSTCFVTRDIYAQHGIFNTRFKFCSDYDLMLRLKDNNTKFIVMPTVISNFTVGGLSATKKASIESLKMLHEKNIIKKRKYIEKRAVLELKSFFSFLKGTFSRKSSK